MLKKISVIISCLAICSCGLLNKTRPSQQQYYDYASNAPANTVELTDYSRVDLGNAESFRVAMLLPLSGKVASMGQSLKNAAMMAVGDLENNNMVVQFYDTSGTPSGARIAVENALSAKSDLVLGPLTSEEVAAISDRTKGADVPMISFSTSPAVLQNDVYSLGLLNVEQIDRIVKYAAGQGRSRLAMVVADTPSGLNMVKAAADAAKTYGVSLVKVGFYPAETMDFTNLVKAMIGSAKVAAAESKDRERATTVKVDFDAVLIPEFGNRLKSITSMFSYYDVAAPDVLFMGTSVWANTNLNKETELYGAVYPVMSLARLSRFSDKYNEMFGERPNGLSIFAYDAVALASALAYKDRGNLSNEITSPDGYFGMSGAFRIFANGKNEHGLDIVKVTAGGQQMVEAAPQKFYSMNPGYSRDGVIGLNGGNMPQIFGKNADVVFNLLNSIQ